MPTDDPKDPVAAPLVKSAEQDESNTAEDNSVEGADLDDAVDAQEEETSDSSADDNASGAEKADGDGEEDGDGDASDLDEFIGKSSEKKKDNVQKRIDQLTAQLKELKTENLNLKKTSEPTSKTPEYTDAQLKAALRKGVEEGDPDLVWEVMEYKTEKAKRDLINQYEQEKSSSRSVVQEWNKVCNDYSLVWKDDSGKEIYPGARHELNIANERSTLYQLAARLMQSTDDDGQPRYAGPGAQRQAVAEAMALILRKRGEGSTDKRKLERALAKEKRKKALISGGSMNAEKSVRRNASEQDVLAEYIAERKKFRQERG